MNRKTFILPLTLLLFLFLSAFTLPPVWTKLGERVINYRVDRDEILITGNQGTFTALKFIVKSAPINLHKMVVHYGNGSVQEVPIRQNIPAGGESRVLDLPGERRVIQKVVFWYDTKNLSRTRASLALWGRR